MWVDCLLLFEWCLTSISLTYFCFNYGEAFALCCCKVSRIVLLIISFRCLFWVHVDIISYNLLRDIAYVWLLLDINRRIGGLLIWLWFLVGLVIWCLVDLIWAWVGFVVLFRCWFVVISYVWLVVGKRIVWLCCYVVCFVLNFACLGWIKFVCFIVDDFYWFSVCCNCCLIWILVVLG